ncbi:MAG: L-serine ammonia-lyase, iron-sulfur-dependent subunit beta [Chloroherpetonaceae bacterium]|nr:L-serine ammonia-lyase, iron-sulfur-dependent subunit beta [Chloroherpetonaceae bacterium]MDW8436915.1 L-serine ammonia-lyase, iron-sulfur-dependent subunit beta [Chloroherpetonaceae bacterium]
MSAPEPSLFDILGPIMIGPSSSHTAGASRIGYIARRLLGETPRHATITLYNSFARTHKGHGTDCAIIGGILGFAPDDERIKDAFEIAQAQGLRWQFKFHGDATRFHSNAARLLLVGERNKIEIVGASLGGGRIKIQEIEGFSVEFNAQLDTLVVIAQDIPGSIQRISGVISESNVNIAQMFVSRNRDETPPMASMVIELDSPLPKTSIETIERFSWVKFARLIESIQEGSSIYEK